MLESNIEKTLPEENLADQPAMSANQPGAEHQTEEPLNIVADDPQGRHVDGEQGLPESAGLQAEQSNVELQRESPVFIHIDDEEEPSANDLGLPDSTIITLPLFPYHIH